MPMIPCHSPLFAAYVPGFRFPLAAQLCLALLLVLLSVWLIVLGWLFHRLRDRHAPTYEAIGSPSLVWNNSLRGMWLFLKFLYSPRWRGLGDSAVSKAVRFLRVFLVAYVLFLIAFVALVCSAGPPQA